MLLFLSWVTKLKSNGNQLRLVCLDVSGMQSKVSYIFGSEICNELKYNMEFIFILYVFPGVQSRNSNAVGRWCLYLL